MSPPVFESFLRALSPDPDEAARRYTRLQKKLAGFLSLRGVSDTAEAAAETLDRAAYKIYEGAQVPEVDRFCLGVARNVAREKLRGEQREQSAFIRFIESLPDPSDEEVERIRRILKPCFEQLSDKDQRMLLAYCEVARGRARAEHRRRVASEMEMTVLALRMRVTRLRGTLDDCVRLRASGGN
jgi:DNA-directed RNA polymerase specialized sigma24 family protein